MPALLSQVVEERHGGTGVVFTLSTAATQLGFITGPLLGSSIMTASSFGLMTLLLGGAVALCAPTQQINARFAHGRRDRMLDSTAAASDAPCHAAGAGQHGERLEEAPAAPTASPPIEKC